MLKKRICALFLSLCTLSSISVTTYAVETRDATAEVILDANFVQKDNKLEVSTKIDNIANATDVGVVLKYDTTKLKLVNWGDNSDISLGTVPTAASTMAYGGAAGKPSLVYKPDTGDYAYLYLGASVIKGALQQNKELSTVQFTVIGSEGITADNLSGYIALATEGEFDYSFVKNYPAILIDQDSTQYIYTTKTPQPTNLISEPTWSFKTGDSLYGGGSTIIPSGSYTITFFDWDGSVIDAITADGDAASNVNTITQSFNQLKDKTGYTFDTWLKVTSDKDGLHRANGTKTSSIDGVQVGNTDIADFSNVTGNMLVQAAYKTNNQVNAGNGANASTIEDFSRYKISAPTFYQYGISTDDTNGQYAVRANVSRQSVLRADKPTILAQAYVGEGAAMKAVTMKIDLANTDETSFEVVVPKQTVRVEFTVLDTDGIAAWTMGTSRSELGSASKANIIKEGAFALLVDEAFTVGKGGNWTNFINVQCFKDAGYSKVTTANIEAAKTAIATASNGKVNPLTRAEADTALSAYK